MEYIFQWDRQKAESNFLKHEVSFEEAEGVFVDPFKITQSDREHSEDEERYLALGYSHSSRLLLVVHTEQEMTVNRVRVRVISCRKATKQERKDYERRIR